MEIAIEGQARAIPFWSAGVYRGTIIHGTGWSSSWDGNTVTAVPYANLQDGIKTGDAHLEAIHQIINSTGEEVGTKVTLIETTKTMNQLRKVVRAAWTKDRNIEVIVKQWGPRLNFGERSWAVNLDTLSRALSILQGKPSVDTLDNIIDLPLHYSQLMSDDVIAVVWSCFGGMAPSFKIPHGRPMKLDGAMKVEITGKNREKTVQDVSKVSVRNVILTQSIADIKWVIDEKMIINPWGQGQIRASQNNQDRFFSGKEAQQLIAALRTACGVTAITGEKKRKGDAGDAGPSKKKKLDFGF